MTMTNAERQKARYIRSKGRAASAEEREWLADYESRKKGSPIGKSAPPPPKIAAESPAPVTVAPPVAVAAAAPASVPPEQPMNDAPAPFTIDMGPEVPPLAPAVPSTPATTPATPASPGTAIAPVKPPDPGMSDELARMGASATFELIAFGWRHFGDRDTPKPGAEQRASLARVIARYATKWGWTSELDDIYILVIVLTGYNMQCANAPKRSEKEAKP